MACFDILARHSFAIGPVGESSDDRFPLLDLTANLGFVGIGVLLLLGAIAKTTSAAKSVTIPLPLSHAEALPVALTLLAPGSATLFTSHLILRL